MKKIYVTDCKAFVLVIVLAQTESAADRISTKMHKKKRLLSDLTNPCQREKQNRKALNLLCTDIVKQSVGFVCAPTRKLLCS